MRRRHGEHQRGDEIAMSDVPIAAVAARSGAERAHGDAVRRCSIASRGRYDLMNRLMSGGIDVAWRKAAVAELARRTATGRCSISAPARSISPRCSRRPIPIAASWPPTSREAMLAKGRARGVAPRTEMRRRRRHRAPVRRRAFARIVCGFGMRNVADLGKALARGAPRARRRAASSWCSSSSAPRALATRAFHALYARGVIPLVGRAVARRARGVRVPRRIDAGLREPRRSTRRCSTRAGFARCAGATCSLGIASIVRAEVPAMSTSQDARSSSASPARQRRAVREAAARACFAIARANTRRRRARLRAQPRPRARSGRSSAAARPKISASADLRADRELQGAVRERQRGLARDGRSCRARWAPSRASRTASATRSSRAPPT